MHLNMIIHLVNPLELKNGANNTINNIYTYKQNIQKEFEKEGWTFDFGLDAEPYELKPLKK